MISSNKSMQNLNSEKKTDKYETVIGLFYAVSLFISIGICLVTGLIFNNPRAWIIISIGSGCLFLVLGLTIHAIITLVRKD